MKWQTVLSTTVKKSNPEEVARLLKASPEDLDLWVKRSRNKKGGKTPPRTIQAKILELANNPKIVQKPVIEKLPEEKVITKLPEMSIKHQPDKANTAPPITTEEIQKRIDAAIPKSESKPTPKAKLKPTPVTGKDDPLVEACRGLHERVDCVKGHDVTVRHILRMVVESDKRGPRKLYWNLIKHQEATEKDYQARPMG